MDDNTGMSEANAEATGFKLGDHVAPDQSHDWAFDWTDDLFSTSHWIAVAIRLTDKARLLVLDCMAVTEVGESFVVFAFSRRC
ncbi:hypothetical protein [Alteromonas sp. a30]|uniref:hypothetical protein n=1 Tax=Alteromonas sp. a30 TaxID=2730917 RepID=UPI00227F5F4E|nr:hypothetical protein [Alteromonas sp. a30]MCY7296082.1 hypothetical protein [Alteromonas sp. a30]